MRSFLVVPCLARGCVAGEMGQGGAADLPRLQPVYAKAAQKPATTLRRISLAPFVAIALVVGGNGAGLAADLPRPEPVYTKTPVPPPASWTGFYVGGGVGFRSADVKGSTTSIESTFFGGDLCAGAVLTPCTSQSLTVSGARFSPYVGYDWQFAPQWLVGIEGEYGFGKSTANLNNTIYPGAGPIATPNGSFAVKTGWDANIRGRFGFLPAPDVLVYATGGPAWQHIESTASCSDDPFECSAAIGGGPFANFPNYAITDSATKLGYTVGGGVETLLGGHWLLRGEYRYANFGTITNTDSICDVAGCATAAQATTYKLQLSTQTATMGLAYKF
jgi:outer membrane immunogenic protein